MTTYTKTQPIEVRIAGKTHLLPSTQVLDRTVVVTGKWLRQAAVMDEELVQGEAVSDPVAFSRELKQSALKADFLTFAQKLPDCAPKYQYKFEWDNWAVVHVTSFKDWWDGKLPQETRKNVRRAAKRGVVTKVAEFNDDLVRGIQGVYDETPLRQGRKFWHYGKDFETVKKENATYLDRSEFLGAYLNDELIGFIKLIYSDNTASLIQILAKNAHQDKRPMNALLAKAIEACESRGISYLLYGKYSYYRNQTSALAEFKKRNGFEEIKVPRYFVPLTLKGALALSSGLNKPLKDLIPSPIMKELLRLRAAYYQRRRSSSEESPEGLSGVPEVKVAQQG